MLPTCVFTPEEEELRQKNRELSYLQQELAEKELLLSTCRSELSFFEKKYSRVVGSKYAELDRLRAQVLEFASSLNPAKSQLREEAETARKHADQTANESEEWEDSLPINNHFDPSDDLKKLFREAAKKIHPDLANSGEEREKRHQLMAELNRAYDNMDVLRIQEIVRDWEEWGQLSEEVPIGVQLVKSIRKIAQVKDRLNGIEEELNSLENSEMYRLKERIEQAQRNGRDVLKEMSLDLEDKVSSIKTRVFKLADDLIYL